MEYRGRDVLMVLGSVRRLDPEIEELRELFQAGSGTPMGRCMHEPRAALHGTGDMLARLSGFYRVNLSFNRTNIFYR